MDRAIVLGPVELRSPLIGASGTVGSGVDFVAVADPGRYGALVAKSVAPDAWRGNRPPRLAPAGLGMLNAIGIQNPGIEQWAAEVGPRLNGVGVPVWGSAVGYTPEDFARVAKGLEDAGVQAVEINLSCPNLDGHGLIALDPAASARVVEAVRRSVSLPVAAKLSPNASDIVAVARSVREAGADWVVLTNTVLGAAIDIETRRPRLSTVTGGYSGPPVKPIALWCVMEVAAALPGFPIVGCGGVTKGADVVEFLLAGASAVAVGTAHFAEPRVAGRIDRELARWCRKHGVARVFDLVGGVAKR
ncbi:MAG: dihydroorotate dehydrogenase [bacterium]|nr:dihydroorotate dehydrogenase [bacterium]MDE0288398.1 dihydroorotate dehydrogenase [bacterium]MDE0438726.1 dihydroorotate dehydrogenase [bacterium]